MSFNDHHLHIDPSLDNERPINKGEDRMILASGVRAECEICTAAATEKAADTVPPVTVKKSAAKQPIV